MEAKGEEDFKKGKVPQRQLPKSGQVGQGIKSLSMNLAIRTQLLDVLVFLK